MGITKQANKLHGKEKEEFLRDYHEAKKRLIEAQMYKPEKQKRKPGKRRNGKVVSYRLEDL